MTVFYMVHGGNPGTPRLCERADWRYGVQFGSTAYDRVRMFDYVVGNWDQYMTALREHRPELALAADFRQPNEWHWIEARIKAIAGQGIMPIVAAKFHGAVDYIPHEVGGVRVRIGVSVPTSHMNDDYIPNQDELRGPVRRNLHLLGGHPDQWLYLMRYYSPYANITSVDGNALFLQAREYGKMWSRFGGYREMRGAGYSTGALCVASMRNAVRFFHSAFPFGSSERVIACMIQAGELPRQQALV